MSTLNHDPKTLNRTKTVTIDRIFPFPVETTWKAWSQPESFKKWWGPKGFTCPHCTIDFKVGGTNLSSMKSPDEKEFWSLMRFLEIIPNKKIKYIDSFADSKGNEVTPDYYDMPGDWANELIVTVTFQDENGKTRFHLTHEGIPKEMVNDCTDGWQQSFDKLEQNFKSEAYGK